VKSKRIFDIAFVLLALPVALPLGLMVAIAVFIDSPGPIFYHSVRIGKGGKPFAMLKFRKMRNEVDGPLVTQLEDGRLTPLGRFLTKSRLDELPQLWNVLKGDMRVVGPRPELLEFVDLYPTEYGEILSVLPGLTGLVQVQFIDESRHLSHRAGCDCGDAQCHCAYSKHLLPDKVALDLTYVRRTSLGLDLMIIFRTLALPISVVAKRAVDSLRGTRRSMTFSYALLLIMAVALVGAYAATAGPLR
jgi:lipopolysaccharide/colanic/teichoic acid biosynthesis glycosyltransferase